MAVLVYILLLFSFFGIDEARLCPIIGPLNDLSIRSPDNSSTYFVDGQGLLLSDDGLDEGWFKTTESAWTYIMTDSNTMPTIGTCSTYWPVYLEGTHPKVEDLPIGVPIDAKACLSIDGFLCGVSVDIQIRNCGFELQYYLPALIPYSAYCFSKYKSVCNEEPQAAAPDMTDLGEVTVSPELYHNDVTIGTKTNHKPYFLMRCGFKTQPGLKYVVDWYVDGKFRVSYGSVREDEIDKLTLHETKIDRLGVFISCAVRASTGQCAQQTDRIYSSSYYAGIKILTPVITMPKGKQETIKMKATVPIGCNYDDGDTSTCTAPVRIFDLTTSGHVCTESSIANINPNVENQQCSKGIESLSVGKQFDADKIFTFDIATIDENYEDKTNFILKLEFGTDIGHQKWKTFTFPDISVRINDTSTYKKKICHSHIDPHMRSSDQHYYENQKIGEFMLYNNLRYKIEVQEKTALCNNNHAKCTCAVAIKAGKDVFTINRCGKINYLEFTRCGDGGILQVVEKHSNLYEVYTPIGTKIAIQLHTGSYAGFMNIDITMAPKDLGNIHGLCGNFDGVKANDLFGRNGITTPLQPYQHPDSFTESWKLKDSENLFKSPDRTLASWGEQNGLYCVCTDSGVTCAPTQYLNCTKPKSITKNKCKIQRLRKRSTARNNDKELKRLFALMNSESKHNIVKREESEIITAEEAMELCTNMINGSLAVRNYSEVGGDEDPYAVIENCAFDVEVGNDRAWANAHVESVNTIVKSMMEYEPTYVINNSEKVETFFVSTCPGNCSDNGNCTKSGECSCKQYYHGATCSIDERDALVIDDIEGGGVCDLAESDECVCFTIRSDNILDGYKCKIQTTLYFKNGTNQHIPTGMETGEYTDIFTGVCCDHDYVRSDNEFGLVYDVSISNNGHVFSNIATVHVLNSVCQEVDTDAQTPFRLKNQTCYIDGVCYVDGDWSDIQKDTCFMCQSSIDVYDWTAQPCPTTTVSTTTAPSMSSLSTATTPTTTSTSTKENTETPSAASTSPKPTTGRETSATSTTNKSTSTEANTSISTAESTPFTSTSESETSAPDAETFTLGTIIGLSTGVPVIVVVVVVITVIIVVRFKKMKHSGMKGKLSGNVATRGSEKGSSMDRDNSFYFENPLNKSYKGIPVAQSGHFNVEGQTFKMSAPSQSSGDLSAVTIDFMADSD